MLKTLRLAAKLLWREAHAGEWITLFLALVFSVTVVTTLDFYTNRVKTSIDQQSNQILGGDLAIVSARPFPIEWEVEATAKKLKHAQVWSYPSVIRANDQLELATIQAVSDSYPILSTITARPDVGHVWVEPRLLPLLKINVHQPVIIGDKTFSVQRTLTNDASQLTTGLSIAPRILMRLSDVPATKTVLPGSRVEYRLLLAGNVADLENYKAWLGPKLQPGQRVVTVRDQQRFINNILQRTDNYLQLIMLICMVMSCIAILLSVYQYLRRHYPTVALWRCLGVQRRQLITIFVTQLGIIALLAGTTGVVIGYFLQIYFNYLLADVLPITLVQAGYLPILKGFVTSILLLLAFAYPLVSDLPRTSPLYLWRSEAYSRHFNSTYYLITIIATITLLLYWIMDITTVTLLFIDLILLGIGIMYGINIALLAITSKLVPYTTGPIKRGLSNLIQHPSMSNLQFSGLTLILTCLFLLGFVRTSLIDNWQQTLPPGTPNYFMFNIAATDVPTIKTYFESQQVEIAALYPMVRGRLIMLNDKDIMSAVPVQSRGYNALHRELNLSWMLSYPSDNKIIKGNVWTVADKGKAIASIESSMANALQLKLGDKLTFQLGDSRIDATISNIRTLDWTSFHPNFYVIFPPGLIDEMSATYITSFHLGDHAGKFLNGIVQQFPNVTLIDIAGVLQQIQTLISKVTTIIQYLFLFALGSAALIVIITIQTSMDERRQTWDILRIIGASKRYLTLSTLTEFSYLLFLIVLTALLISSSFSYFLVQNLLQ